MGPMGRKMTRITGLDTSVDVLCGNRQKCAKFPTTRGWKFENKMVNSTTGQERWFLLFWFLSPFFLEVGAQRQVGLWSTFYAKGSLVAETRVSLKSWLSFRMESPRTALQCLQCRWRRDTSWFLQWESSFQGRKLSTQLEMEAQLDKWQVLVSGEWSSASYEFWKEKSRIWRVV